MSRNLRIFVLLLLLGIEVALLLSLTNRGWVATNTFLVWLRAIGIGVIPIAVGALVFFRSGRRFSLKSIFVLVGCIAIFLVVTLLPLLDAQRNRRTAKVLAGIGALLDTETFTDTMYANLNLPPDKLATTPPSQIPKWMNPIAGDVLNLPLDDLITEIGISSGQQMDLCLANASRLSNVRTIILSGPGLSSSCVTQFFNSATSFPSLRNLQFDNVTVPEDCISKLDCLRSLHVSGRPPMIGYNLDKQQLSQIGRLPNLEVLTFSGCAISDKDIEYLRPCDSLKHIGFWRTKVTRGGIENFEKSHPGCVVVRE